MADESKVKLPESQKVGNSPLKEPAKKLRVMADANVLVSGILFPRWFHEFLRHAFKGDFKLV